MHSLHYGRGSDADKPCPTMAKEKSPLLTAMWTFPDCRPEATFPIPCEPSKERSFSHRKTVLISVFLLWNFSKSNALLTAGSLPRCSLHIQHARRSRYDEYYSDGISRETSQSKSYWESADVDRSSREFYNSSPVDDSAAIVDEMEWERCPTEAGTAHVLLPPPSVDLPSCVIHFVGGTFFGSAPSLWYRQLLLDVVKHTQAAVVATSIPVTLLKSPLQHVELSRKIQKQFQVAWRQVLLDEYGDKIQTLPVCGLGHSLGARLLVVLSTLGPLKSKVSYIPRSYKAYVLMSFTNHGAASGIPGVSQLGKASRQVEWENEESQREDTWRDQQWPEDDGEIDDDDDSDLGGLWRELQGAVTNQASRLRDRLTPKQDELEFHPSPDQLWKALSFDRRYHIPQTLVVQFDDDRVDQSSKLAVAISGSSDVKFARLRGTHLTPVSQAGTKGEWLTQLNSRAGRILWRLMAGRKSTHPTEEALRELRQSIARYVMEVVTKDC